MKGQRQHSSLSGLYSLQLNPLENRATNMQIHFPPPTPPPPIAVEQVRVSCFTSERTVWLVTSGCRIATLGTYSPEGPLPATSHHRVVPGDQDNQVMKRMPTSSGNTGHFSWQVTPPQRDPGSFPVTQGRENKNLPYITTCRKTGNTCTD